MEECGAILRSKTKHRILSPIHAVPKKNGKFRLVVDMRYLNSHLMVPKFKMEGLETLAAMVEEGDHMFTVDLQDGYYHINMAQNALPYMGLQWKGIYYIFRVLPFGLAISPLVFSKVMRAIIVHLRHFGHRILRTWSRENGKRVSLQKIPLPITEIGSKYIRGKVKFKVRADKGVSWPEHKYSGKTDVFRSAEKKVRSSQGDHETTGKVKESTPSKKSSEGSRLMHISVARDRSNKTADVSPIYGSEDGSHGMGQLFYSRQPSRTWNGGKR